MSGLFALFITNAVSNAIIVQILESNKKDLFSKVLYKEITFQLYSVNLNLHFTNFSQSFYAFTIDISCLQEFFYFEKCMKCCNSWPLMRHWLLCFRFVEYYDATCFVKQWHKNHSFIRIKLKQWLAAWMQFYEKLLFKNLSRRKSFQRIFHHLPFAYETKPNLC